MQARKFSLVSNIGGFYSYETFLTLHFGKKVSVNVKSCEIGKLSKPAYSSFM